ncbi:MAG: glycosyltransferase family 2 protein [Actinobacteria bacterium]|nr:MAG: glycosyltransferase family 2 protein [Actinomycetota bacterium]
MPPGPSAWRIRATCTAATIDCRAVPGPQTTSVIVATRDRPQRLRACLELLRAQAADEVLVVDDGSRDEAAVAAAAREGGARLVRQAPAGVATARNTGVEHARGDLLLFTDDDCVPADGWAVALSDGLRDGADVVAGPVHAGRPERAVDVAWQLISDRLVDGSYLLGGNFGARSTALADVPFDARFDGVGAEDRDWWQRVRNRGLRVDFVPEASIDHEPDLGLMRFARKQVRYGRGAYRFRARHHRGRTGSPGFYGALLRDAAREGPGVAALVILAQAATAAGFAAEAVTAWASPR